MGLKGPLACAQQPSTGPHPEPLEYALTPCFLKTHLTSTYIYSVYIYIVGLYILNLQSGLFPSSFLSKSLYKSLVLPKTATCSVHISSFSI
jgi:hypothetical protein